MTILSIPPWHQLANRSISHSLPCCNRHSAPEPYVLFARSSVKPINTSPNPDIDWSKSLADTLPEEFLLLLNQQKIGGVLFDMDGTLIRNHLQYFPNDSRRFNQIMRKFIMWCQEHLPLLPGGIPQNCKKLVKTLKKHGLPCAIVSNNPSQRFPKRVSKALGIPVYNKAKKPDVRVVNLALNQLRQAKGLANIPTRQFAMVGDLAGTDVQAGINAGMFTILVKTLT